MIFDEEINQTIRYIKPSGIRKFFDVKMAPDEIIHVTLVQIRAM